MEWWQTLLIVFSGLLLLFFFSNALYRQCFKRIYDIVLSLIALIVLSPFLSVLTIINAIAMQGNPFFIQLRPGKKDKKTGREKIFKLIKFRTMSDAKDERGNLLSDADRLNKFGRALRNSSLDELPELFNILAGHLSIVGPRPQLVRDMVFMTEEQRHRHDVRQGLTGLAQCSGRNNMSWERKFAYDLKYVNNITFFGDIKILFKTVIKVLKRDGITEEGMATAEDYGDYLLNTGVISKDDYDKKQQEAILLLKG